MLTLVPTDILITEIHTAPVLSIAAQAWMISRPHVTPEQAAGEAMLIDAPINDIPSLYLKMRVPILFREVIFSMRDHHAWARTSRVDDLLTTWPVVTGLDEFSMDEISRLGERMFNEMTHDVTQDDYRTLLPLAYMTEFAIRLSLRQAIRLIKYFDHLGEWFPLHDQAQTVVKQLSEILLFQGVPVAKMVERYVFVELCPTPQWNAEWARQGRIGDTIVVRLMAPLALRAQVIRHGELSVTDDLGRLLAMAGIWYKPLRTEVRMEISANVHVWQQLISKRTCWLAHTDLWAPILNRVTAMLLDTASSLPCADGKCPYDGDCMQRLSGNDPGVPCPRHLNLTTPLVRQLAFSKASPAAYAQEQTLYLAESGRPREFWNAEIDQMIKGATQ